MKKLKMFIIFLFILITKSFAEVKINTPEVLFPIEVITEKYEEKSVVYPPKVIDFKVKINIRENFDKYIKPTPPVDVPPIEVFMEKPKTFLGLPKDNALLSDAIESFYKKEYYLTEDLLDKLFSYISKQKDYKKNLEGRAYYLLGLTKYKGLDKNEAYRYFLKGCYFPKSFPEKLASCKSAVILALQLGKHKEADKILKTLNKSIDTAFLLTVDYFLKEDYKQSLKLSKLYKCDELDIAFIEYCKYVKGFLSFINKDYKTAISYLEKVKSNNYKKQTTLLMGLSYLKLNDLANAEILFRKYLKDYGSVDRLSTYAIYGLSLVNLKKGEFNKALRLAGTLEGRDKLLAQSIYLKLADIYIKKGKFEEAFSLLQKSLKISTEYKEDIKKKLAITAYNRGKYKYAYQLMKDIKDPYFKLFTGYTLVWLGKSEKATKYLKEALNYNLPRDYELNALKLLADLYYRLDKEKSYLDTVRKISKIDRNEARNLLGWFFFKKKQYDKALKAFVNPYMKAVSAFNLNDFDTALKFISRLKTKKAKFLEAYIYLKKGEYDVARDILGKLARGFDKISQEAGYLYAYSFFTQGDYEKAIEEFRKFISITKDKNLKKLATLRLADSYYNLGKKELARRIYETFIRQHTNSKEAIDAAYQLTVLEMENSKGDVEKQILTFLRKYPRYPLADLLRLQLADIYISKKKYDKAEKLLKYLIKKGKEESDYALYKLAYLMYIKGDFNEAKKLAQEYLQKYDKGKFKNDILELLSKIYEEEGNYTMSIKYARELPQTDNNIYKLALLYFKIGDLKNAKYYFEKLYDKNSGYKKEIAYYLGLISYKLGDLNTALRYFEEATNSDDYKIAGESYYYTGRIYQQLGKEDEAINSYLNVIYLYPDLKQFVSKARLRVAEILKKQGKQLEAKKMLNKINIEYLSSKEKRLYQQLRK